MKGTLFSDGGARGNPGPAGAGGIVKGDKPLTVSQYLGTATNNQAEYTALILTLQKALQEGYSELDIYADSELMIKQLRGEYKVKNQQLLPLYLEAQKLLQQLKKWSLTHVRREYNKEADQLVNEAIDNELQGN